MCKNDVLLQNLYMFALLSMWYTAQASFPQLDLDQYSESFSKLPCARQALFKGNPHTESKNQAADSTAV